MKIKSILTLLLMIVALGAKGQTQLETINATIDGLNYELIPETREAYVLKTEGVSGELVIPTIVTHGDIEYRVVKVEDHAFENNTGITSVTFGDNIDYVEGFSFFGCTNLTSVTFGKQTRVIGGRAFEKTAITSVDLPNRVTHVLLGAFHNCRAMKTLTIGNSVTGIICDAFEGCTAVTDVYCYANPATLNWPATSDDTSFSADNCFLPNKGTKCHVVDAEEWNTRFPDLNLDFVGDLAAYVDNNIYYFIDGSTAYVGKSFHATGDITILDKITVDGVDYPVTSIIDEAFRANNSITSVTFGNNVATIGDQAFAFCEGLTTVTIPASVTYIGDGAFYRCSGVTDVYCSAEPTNLTWVSNGLWGDFSGDTKFHVSSVSEWKTAFPDAWVDFVEPTPDLVLDVTQDNTAVIEDNTGDKFNVTLDGYKLYKDGCWNTLCFPFEVRFDGSIFEDASVMVLSSASYNNGTLTLNFMDLSDYGRIPSFIPLIVKWENTGETIESPKFNDVDMGSNVMLYPSSVGPTEYPRGEPMFDEDGRFILDETTGMPVLSTPDATMKGCWGPVTLAANDKTKLFMGVDNTLYYPAADVTIGAFHAYFNLNNGVTAGDITTAGAKGVTSFVLNFGDDTTEIVNIEPDTQQPSVNSLFSEWYTLDGRKLSGIPSAKGIYIHNGHKVMIK